MPAEAVSNLRVKRWAAGVVFHLDQWPYGEAARDVVLSNRVPRIVYRSHIQW